MFEEIKRWDKKLNDGKNLADVFYEKYGSHLFHNVKKIAFVGMGGSGIAGRFCKLLLEKKTNLAVSIVDYPGLPGFVDSETLAIVVSYSGMTWETLDVLQLLVKKHIPCLVVSHGGRALEVAVQNNIPHVIIPTSLTPRSALGLFMGFFMTLFDLVGVINNGKKILDQWISDVKRYVPILQDQSGYTDFLNHVQHYETFHVWGVTGDSEPAAYRATTQFNENSKVQAVYSPFPELAHNLLVGFEKFIKPPLVVFLHTEYLAQNMTIGINAISQILAEKGVVLYKPPILGDTFESQLFMIVLWSDFASYHLGKLRGVNIERVQIIDDLKKRQQIN